MKFKTNKRMRCAAMRHTFFIIVYFSFHPMYIELSSSNTIYILPFSTRFAFKCSLLK